MSGSCWERSRRIGPRILEGEMPRKPGPAAGATISDADDRPYRRGAAAAGAKNGRGVDHARAYKAAAMSSQANACHAVFALSRGLFAFVRVAVGAHQAENRVFPGISCLPAVHRGRRIAAGSWLF